MLRQGPWAVCALLVSVVVGAPALALDGVVAKVEAPGLEEGRPGTIRATWTNTGAAPVVLERLELSVTQGAQRWHAERRTGRAVPARSLQPLADEQVSLELIASEPMHPAAARLPLPSVEARLEGEPMHAVRLLGVGRSVSVSLDLVPGAGKLSATALASVAALPGRAYVRGGVTTWTTTQNGGGPGIRPGRDPLGARNGGSKVPIQVRLTRWVRWAKGKPASEVLVGKLQGAPVTTTHALTSKAAAFTLTAARMRANVAGVDQAVRLADGRWILQGAGKYWLVGPKGPVIDGRGSLFPLALDLAKRGKAGFLWYATPSVETLKVALQKAKFGVDRGKAWSIQITAARLAEYLKLLSDQGVYPHERGIARKPPGPPASKRLTIDAKLLPNYPAALVSLDEGKVRSLPPRKAFTEAKGDLWIEPDDPEIAGLSKRFAGAVHPGLDTQVAPVDTAFEALKTIPATPAWKRHLPIPRIKVGQVFLVRSSSGKVYKVVLRTVEEHKIVLEYAPLTR